MIEQQDISAEARAFMRALYGENKQITDDRSTSGRLQSKNYDKSLAVKCINGTFVGKKKDNVIAYKGIPFVGKQPVGELRWKAPVDFVPDEGIYEAYYYGKSPYQADGDPCSLYVMGEDCLYLNVWQAAEPSAGKKPVMVWIYGGGFETGGTVDPQYDCYNFIMENPDVIVVTISPDGKAKEWPLYDLENKQVMVLDEFNIHPEKESERKIVDWERTYFLTKYYVR